MHGYFLYLYFLRCSKNSPPPYFLRSFIDLILYTSSTSIKYVNIYSLLAVLDPKHKRLKQSTVNNNLLFGKPAPIV